jgi:hypothetical protein
VADWQRQDTLIIHPGATAKSLIRDFHPGWVLGVAGERSATPRYANYTPGSPTAKSLLGAEMDCLRWARLVSRQTLSRALDFSQA